MKYLTLFTALLTLGACNYDVSVNPPDPTTAGDGYDMKVGEHDDHHADLCAPGESREGKC